MSYELPHLDALESEAIHVMREVAAEFERPVLLFSGGKDSVFLLRIAEKAFRPGRFPFPLMQIATGHEFPEVTDFIERRVGELGERLIVASVQESIDRGRAVEDRKSTRLNSSHANISYAVFCLKKKKLITYTTRHPTFTFLTLKHPMSTASTKP